MSKVLDAKAEDKAKKSVSVKPAKKPRKSIIKYFKDVRSEFRKVVWPSKKSVVNNTIVVLVMMVVSALFIWGCDSLFDFLMKLIHGSL